MAICPNCGSVNHYIHDKGWLRVWRLFTLNSRMVCRDCNSTWRRRRPQRFAKLKRKIKVKKIRKDTEYTLIKADAILNFISPEQRNSVVGKWQEENNLFICLDLAGQPELTTQKLGNLMDYYRRMKAIGGHMIISGASVEVRDFLWSLNLSHLLATDQIIKA